MSARIRILKWRAMAPSLRRLGHCLKQKIQQVCCFPNINYKKSKLEKLLAHGIMEESMTHHGRVMDFQRSMIVHLIFSEYFTMYYAKYFLLISVLQQLFQESTVITSILIMKIQGLDLGETAQLLSGIAETLAQTTELPNHGTLLHSF